MGVPFVLLYFSWISIIVMNVNINEIVNNIILITEPFKVNKLARFNVYAPPGWFNSIWDTSFPKNNVNPNWTTVRAPNPTISEYFV